VYNWIKKFGQELEEKKFIDCSFANRGTKTGQKLWKKIKNKEIEEVMTDHWSICRVPSRKHSYSIKS
jgi:IS1 family transposase